MNASARKRILLVDDSPIIRAVVVHTLSASGLEVTTIEDPRELDGAVERDAPELLLVDATFPGITDELLVALVSKHSSTLPVVLFSDRPKTDIDRLVQLTGAHGAVPKEGATLVDALASFLAR